MTGILNYSIIFFVQSFYAHRVWIISGGNKWMTFVVSVTTFFQCVFGLWCMVRALQSRTLLALYKSLSTCGTASGLGTFCDMLITASFFYYLSPRRTGVKRAATPIQQLLHVVVSTGLFTCLLSLIMFVSYMTQRDMAYMVGPPGQALSKSYVNSMLAVLNARRSIREHSRHSQVTYRFSTIALSAVGPPSRECSRLP
ncbi:hypothetical protein BJ138DRAFT_1149081 [Hygrophoropsis aurantiaca]|uniref:Uncharacterized protein n=1 Tax=Hygrophoropsis aurantiaca TaxID=72124 RepID=A0ACB8AF35_9AGAM|nr:hypothetical protein BJ138DRAFT_1149081 [Hygrophoropsis aurantiaca]